MRLIRWIVGAFALLAVALPAHAQVKVVGDWHGVLQSAVGPMTLIVTIVEDEKGALGGELASPDQGPGKIPLTTVSTTDSRLAFTIKPAQICTTVSGSRPNSTGRVCSRRARKCR